RYGTLDALSGGRLILGVGVGTLEEEFAVLDARFDGRGEQADDALRALQASLGRPVPAYEGKHYRYAAMVVEPHAVQEHVPLWVGGRTGRSLRRAVTPADGWMPMALSPEQCAKMVADADAPPGFDLVLGPPRPLDPAGHPDRTQEMLARLAGAGATVVNAVFRHRTLSEYLEQMEALSELAGLEVGA
ncbi:MAG TPA: LLM class flavin-dependent oxidoreductase, partial [Acidimicrobiales bacterium]|nr:LLM class flavin-dependent oxidoreductase [Acidimicrobiales bacterium]